MSVDRTDYVIYGIRLPFDDLDYDEYEAEICGKEGRRFDLIYDGMSGKYAIAGKIIVKGDQYEGFGLTSIKDVSYLEKHEYIENCKNIYNRNDFQYYFLAHWH